MSFFAAARHWVAERRRRVALRRLLDHNDQILADIGLLRAEVESALALPIDADAAAAARATSLEALRAKTVRHAADAPAQPELIAVAGGAQAGAVSAPCQRAKAAASAW